MPQASQPSRHPAHGADDAALDEASDAFDEASGALDEASDAFDEASGALNEATDAFDEASGAFDESSGACDASDAASSVFTVFTAVCSVLFGVSGAPISVIISVREE